MPFWNKYPFTDFHELNLDWIISKVGQIEKNLKETLEAMAKAITAQEKAEEAQVKAETAQEGAETAEDNAETAETNTREYYNNLVTHIAEDVTGWLDNNVNPVGSAVTVDSSLTISGSAADAKATGNLKYVLSTLRSIYSKEQISEETYNDPFFRLISGGIASDTGNNTTAPGRCRTPFIETMGKTAIVLDSNEYEMLVWTYSTSGASNSGVYSPSNGYQTNTPVFFDETDNSNYFRISFGRIDHTTPLTTDLNDPDSDYYKIRHALHIYNLTDNNLNINHGVADSAEVGFRFSTLFSNHIDDPNSETDNIFRIINGGINSTTGANTSATNRCRTAFIKSNNSPLRIAFTNSTYKMIIVGYSIFNVTTSESYVKTFYTDIPTGNDLYINTNDCDYVRIAFGRRDDESITDSDKETIQQNLSIYSFTDPTLSVSGVPADAGSVNDALSNLNDSFTVEDVVSHVTTYSGVVDLFDSLASTSPVITKNILTSNNVSIAEYVITTGNYNTAGQRARNSEIDKPKILICAGIHGYEQSSVMGLYQFVDNLVNNNNKLSDIMNGIELHIIPIVCEYGYNNYTRLNENNVNINRNFNSSTWTLTSPGEDYSGATPGDQSETQIVQTWLENNSDAKLFIDWHNSGFVNELSCILGGSSETEMEFKKTYLLSINKPIAYWKKTKGLPSTTIFSYTGRSTASGSSISYANDLNIPAFTLECSYNIKSTGRDSSFTIGRNAEVIGNLLKGIDYDKLI